ncbi:MAG: hypothetical protein VX252_13810 [Myxococcota bacterium]|nr:hypothetical protein [Myxococcota bacterium]
MTLNLLLIAFLASPVQATEIEHTNWPKLQVGPARYGPNDSLLEMRWVAPQKIHSDISLQPARAFKSNLPEFPPEEFSFSLVEYSSLIRVAENDLIFRFEAPGIGRALVSCEFIF